MTFDRTPWLALGLCLLVTLPTLADVRRAQRNLGFARDAIQQNRYDEAERKLQQAEQELEGVAEAERKPVEAEIAQAREDLAQAIQAYEEGRVIDRARRGFEYAQDTLDKNTDSARGFAAELEDRLRHVQEALDSEEARKSLSAPERARIEAKLETFRKSGAAKVLDIHVGNAQEQAEKIDRYNGGDDADQDPGVVAKWFDYAQEALDQVPAGDPRREQLERHLSQARATFDQALAKGDRDHVVGYAQETWRSFQESYGREAEGWESEQPPSYADWLASRQLGMTRTLARYDVAARMLDGGLNAALEQYAADPEVVKLKQEVEAYRRQAADKLCAAANGLLEQAEADQESGGERIKGAVEGLLFSLQRSTEGSAQSASTLARAQALVQAIEDKAAAGEAAAKKLKADCLAAANALWPQWLTDYQTTDLDAKAALDDPDAWQGRHVRLEGRPNRAGWDYERGDYDFITPLNGRPVAARLDDGLAEAIAAVRKATGLAFDEQDIEDFVAVVDGTCQVQGMHYDQVLKEYLLRGAPQEAPLLRIVAVKAGPWAVSLEHGTQLQSVEGAEELAVAGSTSGGGFGTFMKLVLGVLFLFGTLVALGVVVAVVYWQQQKSASQAAGAPSAPQAPQASQASQAPQAPQAPLAPLAPSAPAAPRPPANP